MNLRLFANGLRKGALGLAILWFSVPAAFGGDEADLHALATRLGGASLKEVGEIVEAFKGLDDPRARPIMEALLAGRLYVTKGEAARLVFAEPAQGEFVIEDALTGKALGSVGRFEAKRIPVNNRIRARLKGAMARFDLAAPEADRRLKAVEDLLGRLDSGTVMSLEERLPREDNPQVREAIETALALAALESGDRAAKLEALERLRGILRPDVRTRIASLADEAGSVADEEVRRSARSALRAIDLRLWLCDLAETLFFGLSLGSILALAAIGLAITFGVMGVINMAHGELIMLGAYTTYVVQLLMPDHVDYSLFVAVPAAFLISGAVGIAIERGVIRFLYGRPLETLLATFGVSLFLQQLVRSVFSPLNRSVTTPSWMSGSWEINPALSFTLNRLYIVLFAIAVFFALVAILKKSRLGLEVRAVSQNRNMARAMGIPTGRVDALTFGLGSGIAGVAGVALSQITNVGPNLGQSYIVDSFMVVVFGGVGNLWGAMVGGLSLGIVNKFLEPYAGAVLAKVLILVFIIIFIQRRPRGLFPQKGRAAEV